MQFFPPILFQPVRLLFLTNLPTNTFIPTSTTIPDFRVFLFFLHIPIFFHIFPGFNFLLNASLKILKAIVSLSQFHGMSSIVLVISHNLLQGLHLLASIMLYKQNSKDQNCPWKPYSNSWKNWNQFRHISEMWLRIGQNFGSKRKVSQNHKSLQRQIGQS